MIEIKTHIRQDIAIADKTKLYGMITGRVSVINSSILYVNGTINGEIVIQKNSSAIILGTVNGNIFNEGICMIYGTVNGKLIGNNFTIDPKALIKD